MVLITESGPETLNIGDNAPNFDLRGTDETAYSLDRFAGAKAIVIAFTCNHCPYARAYDDRLAALVEEFTPQGAAFIAINPNDAETYPDDSFENMVKRKLPYPYAQDASQEVAKAYGAVCTPHFFVLTPDHTIAYEGRLDDNWKEPEKAKHHDLRDAIQAVLNGQPAPQPNTNPMGCSIKWKTS